MRALDLGAVWLKSSLQVACCMVRDRCVNLHVLYADTFMNNFLDQGPRPRGSVQSALADPEPEPTPRYALCLYPVVLLARHLCDRGDGRLGSSRD